MVQSKTEQAMFVLGEIVVTPKALAALMECGQSVDELLSRHQRGDWGDITAAERRINDHGVARHFNLVSWYCLADGQRLTVVTKADRSCTTVHLAPHARSN